MTNRIGIIGLGIMGGAFARNLAAGGWNVIGYDVDRQRNAEAKAAGVEIAHSAEAVAEAAPDIITSLPTPRAVLDTAEVIARANAKGRTVVEASTLDIQAGSVLGNVDFGGGSDVLSLSGNGIFRGTLSNSAALAVNLSSGSLLDVQTLGTVNLGSLNAGAGSSLGVTIALIMWVYYSAVVFVVGANVVRVLEQRRGHRAEV